MSFNLTSEDAKKIKNSRNDSVSLRDFVKKYPDGMDFTYNVRIPEDGLAVNEMKKTLHTAPGCFHLGNNGITAIVCKGKTYVLNGGHSSYAILEAYKEGADYSKDGKVSVEYIFIENESDVKTITPKIAKAKNTSKMVTKASLVNLAGGFDLIKEGLADFASNFEFKPGENQDGNTYNVGLVLGLLNSISGNSPITSYKNKGTLISNHEKYPSRFNDLAIWSPSAIKLWAKAHRFIETKKPGKRDGVEKRSQNSLWVLPDGSLSEYKISEAYVWPIFHAFSEIFKLAEGDPDMFDIMVDDVSTYIYSRRKVKSEITGRHELVSESVMDVLWNNVTDCKKSKDSFELLGRNEALYEKNCAVVSNAWLKMELENLRLRVNNG